MGAPLRGAGERWAERGRQPASEAGLKGAGRWAGRDWATSGKREKGKEGRATGRSDLGRLGRFGLLVSGFGWAGFSLWAGLGF